MRYITTILFLLLAPSVLAQTVDTTSAWRYFPLEVGNVWEYEGLGLLNYSSDYRLTVESEVEVEGKQYFVVGDETLDGSPSVTRSTVRYDASTGHIVARGVDGLEYVWWYTPCPFNAAFGAETECGEVEGGYEESFELSGGTLLQGVTYKTFSEEYSHLWGYIAGIGPVTRAILAYEPGEERLRYARVSGVEYGSPFAVASEDNPQDASTALAVYPNPTLGVTTLFVALGRPQRATLAIYDVLGRRVRTEDLGALPAGERTHRLYLGALPPGLYVVRLDGEAGARATARLVVQ